MRRTCRASWGAGRTAPGLPGCGRRRPYPPFGPPQQWRFPPEPILHQQSQDARACDRTPPRRSRERTHVDAPGEVRLPQRLENLGRTQESRASAYPG
jgi:hypothetical protein